MADRYEFPNMGAADRAYWAGENAREVEDEEARRELGEDRAGDVYLPAKKAA